MKKGIVTVGEALIDFIPADHTNLVYEKCPGGAPANVAVGLAKLGAKSTFVGKAGDDTLGRFLKQTLTDYGVDVSGMVLTTEAKTGLTFVTLDADGERSFDFYIKPSADQFLSVDNIDSADFGEAKILHIGSISMISEVSRNATVRAVQFARDAGMLISYDPNLRLGLWNDKDTARKTMVSMLNEVDIMKISLEELEFISGTSNVEEGIRSLAEYDIPLIFVTLGEKGSYVIFGDHKLHIPAMKVDAIDTTGAGDAFVSGLLYCINETSQELRLLSKEAIEDIGRFASASGGLAASKKGAMTALPEKVHLKRQL